MAITNLKQSEAPQQPLVLRPLEEILKVALEAGRGDVRDRAFFETFGTEASYAWQDKVMPESLGLSDDEFNDVTGKAEAAYRDGMFAGCQGSAAPANRAKVLGEYAFNLSCASEVFDWLGEFFDGIEHLAKSLPCSIEQQRILRLAGCGHFMAHDRRDLIAEEAANLSE